MAFGRRLSSTDWESGSDVIYATKRNTPELVIRGGATYRVVSDQLGSPVLVIKPRIPATSRSKLLTRLSDLERYLRAVTTGMPFGFVGGLYDSDTKLTRFCVRDYDPTIGRWLAKIQSGLLVGRQTSTCTLTTILVIGRTRRNRNTGTLPSALLVKSLRNDLPD